MPIQPKQKRAVKGTSQPLVAGLLRGLAVLRCFHPGHERLGSSEIARMTGLPQPTAWRLCKTLEHGGYLVADPDGARFRPGLAILTLGYSALDTLELAELARPLLHDVAVRFRGAACLATSEGTSMLYLQRCEAPRSFLNVSLRVGSEVPIISSGTGWAYLAALAPAMRKSALQACRKSSPTLYEETEKHALAAIAQHAKRGYVVNADVFFPGLTTVAVPVARGSAHAQYVISCTSPSIVLARAEARRDAGEALLNAASQLHPIVVRMSDVDARPASPVAARHREGDGDAAGTPVQILRR